MKQYEVIKGNLDYLNYKKNYFTSIIVKGDILSGIDFKVNGDLVVEGNVENVNIKCAGNVVIKNGFLGQDKGIIINSGKFFAKYILNGNVKSGNDIVVSLDVSFSNILSLRNVYVKNKIVGGNTYAKDSIQCNECGSNSIVQTNLYAGYDFLKRKKFEKIKKIIINTKFKLETNKKMIMSYFNDIDFSEEFVEIDLIMKNLSMLNNKKNVFVRLLENIELKEKISAYKDYLEKFSFKNIANLNAFIKFKKAHPGVNVFLLDKTLKITTLIQKKEIIITRENLDKWQQY